MMKMNMKKLLCGAMGLMMCFSLAACGNVDNNDDKQNDNEGKKYVIGISQYGEHAS